MNCYAGDWAALINRWRTRTFLGAAKHCCCFWNAFLFLDEPIYVICGKPCVFSRFSQQFFFTKKKIIIFLLQKTFITLLFGKRIQGLLLYLCHIGDYSCSCYYYYFLCQQHWKEKNMFFFYLLHCCINASKQPHIYTTYTACTDVTEKLIHGTAQDTYQHVLFAGYKS